MEQRKRLEITEAMLEQIQKVTGTTVSASDIVVYEAAALSTNPLTKQGSIYNGARATHELLVDMAVGVRSGEHSVPLHTLHQQGGELPVGRVFDAEVVGEADGSSTLLARFYLPATEEELISKIDLAVLDEVSVGVKSKKALCSKCGFDYFGEGADPYALWDQTCPEGHTIGIDGTHLNLVGLDSWMELSLVSRGASDNPKIRSRVKSMLPQATYDRLAATGVPAEAVMLFTKTPMERKILMDAEIKAAFDGLTEKMEGLVTALTAAAAAPAPAPAAETEASKTAELEAMAAELQTAKDRLAALEAATTAEPAAPAVVPPQVITAGGVSASAISDAKPGKALMASAAAFKTRKRTNQ